MKDAKEKNLPDWVVPKDTTELKAAVVELLKVQRTDIYSAPEDIKYSAFTYLSRCTVFSLDPKVKATAYDVLNEMG